MRKALLFLSAAVLAVSAAAFVLAMTAAAMTAPGLWIRRQPEQALGERYELRSLPVTAQEAAGSDAVR